jgi:hypothetical protein
MADQQQRPTASARADAPKAEPASTPTGYQPHANTIWLCEDRQGWERECRTYLIATHGKIVGSIVQHVAANRLGPNHDIVVLFSETKRSDRHNHNGKKIGVNAVRSVVQAPAVKCADYYAEGSTVDDIGGALDMGGVQIINMRDADGKPYPGLCDAVTKACMRDSDTVDRWGKVVKAPTVRMIYRADTKDLRVARDA